MNWRTLCQQNYRSIGSSEINWVWSSRKNCFLGVADNENFKSSVLKYYSKKIYDMLSLNDVYVFFRKSLRSNYVRKVFNYSRFVFLLILYHLWLSVVLYILLFPKFMMVYEASTKSRNHLYITFSIGRSSTRLFLFRLWRTL